MKATRATHYVRFQLMTFMNPHRSGHCNKVVIVPLIEVRGVGRSLGVGTDLGVGVTLGVEMGVAVAVAVGLDEEVGVAVGVWLGVGVDVAVAVGVGEGVGVGVAPLCTSKEPISMRPLTTRSKPGPRWSKKGGGVKFGSPASMAGLPGNSSCVNVGPPLFCNCPSNGSVLTWSPGPIKKPPPSSLLRLYPSDITVPPLFEILTPEPPAFSTVFPSLSVPMLKTPPPRLDELSLSVLLALCSVPMLKLPPPAAGAALPLSVLLVIVNVLAPAL